MIAQHHERLDGSGPRRRPGRTSAAQPDRGHRASLRALDRLLEGASGPAVDGPVPGDNSDLFKQSARGFDNDLLKLMITQVGFYPVGCKVELNNHAICEVARQNEGSPLRPVVRLLVDGSGSRPDVPRLIDLRQVKILSITRTLTHQPPRDLHPLIATRLLPSSAACPASPRRVCDDSPGDAHAAPRRRMIWKMLGTGRTDRSPGPSLLPPLRRERGRQRGGETRRPPRDAPLCGAPHPFRVGDKIVVQVWLKDKISQPSGYPLELEVPDSGEVFFPHIGLVPIEGRTSEIQEELACFTLILNDVQVIAAKRAVFLPGGDPKQQVELGQHFLGRGPHRPAWSLPAHACLRVRDAIALAGGPERYAKSSIFLVRGDATKPEVLRIDVSDIFEGTDSARTSRSCPRTRSTSRRRPCGASPTSSAPLPARDLLRDTLWVYDRSTGQN
jgi:hypothetical protein